MQNRTTANIIDFLTDDAPLHATRTLLQPTATVVAPLIIVYLFLGESRLGSISHEQKCFFLVLLSRHSFFRETRNSRRGNKVKQRLKMS